jgi:predicted proteasome-type protease
MNITKLKVYSARLVLRRKYGKPVIQRINAPCLSWDGRLSFPRISMCSTWDSESSTILATVSIRSTICIGSPLFLLRLIM